MVTHHFARFLEDPVEYHRALDHWTRLWERVDAFRRNDDGWTSPWLCARLADGSLDMDGNPIFTAFSPSLRKGLRIIQEQPTSERIEFQLWFDTFGGPLTDSESIRELVILCELSDETSDLSLQAMRDWVNGKPIFSRFAQFRRYSHGIIEELPSLLMHVGEAGELVTV